MIPRKILYVVVSCDNSYILFDFIVITILRSLVIRLTIITNIQVITLLNFL